MKLYKFAHCDYEGGDDYTFTHPDNPTDEQFEKDCHSLLKKHGKAYLKGTDFYATSSDWLAFAMQHMGELGYVCPETIWSSIFSTRILERIKDDTTEHFAKFEKIVGTELTNKACTHNDYIYTKSLK